MRLLNFMLGILLLSTSVQAQSENNCQGYIRASKKMVRGIFLDKIHFKKDSTVIYMHYRSTSAETSIWVNPPKSSFPFILKTHDKSYPLLKAANIADKPRKQYVPIDSSHYFQLYFEPIPVNITKFDLIEKGMPVENSFNFYDIQITRCKGEISSIRFVKEADFDRYFIKNKIDENISYEGYWEVTKSFEGEKDQLDKVAVVKEDGIYRAYYLDGKAYGTEFSTKKVTQYINRASFKMKINNTDNVISYTKKLSPQWMKTAKMKGQAKAKNTLKISYTWKRTN